ncbi:hypothetical protein chiPu_0013055 [Chiloscyllium punctatum]|uniref:Uncharacterized protein n=1 Tax=Chiloscyllium punctatum TaxID=137246 RepID=A0A401SW27_CHIPU|nr:hypothetical protein [Chiloscyllium punctatum]
MEGGAWFISRVLRCRHVTFPPSPCVRASALPLRLWSGLSAGGGKRKGLKNSGAFAARRPEPNVPSGSDSPNVFGS